MESRAFECESVVEEMRLEDLILLNNAISSKLDDQHGRRLQELISFSASLPGIGDYNGAEFNEARAIYAELCTILEKDPSKMKKLIWFELGNTLLEVLTMICDGDVEKYMIVNRTTPHWNCLSYIICCYGNGYGYKINNRYPEYEKTYKTQSYNGNNFKEICSVSLELAWETKKKCRDLDICKKLNEIKIMCNPESEIAKTVTEYDKREANLGRAEYVAYTKAMELAKTGNYPLAIASFVRNTKLGHTLAPSILKVYTNDIEEFRRGLLGFLP